MASTLFTGISELHTVSERGVITNGAVIIHNGTIQWVGAANEAPAADQAIDCGRRAVLPGWVDSHTHMIFAGDRSQEFAARMAGEDYAAGGIAVTMNATREAGEHALTELLKQRIRDAHAGGTTTIETKTGYGLDTQSEALAARIAAAHVDDVTFLGAHLVPPGADPDTYLDEVCGPMLDAVAPHAQWIDVFCERGA